MVAPRYCALLVLALFNVQLFAKDEDKGYISPLFDNWKKNGELHQEKQVVAEKLTLTLWTQDGSFDVTAFLDGKDTAKFADDVLDIAQWSAAYADEALDGPVHEYNLVLTLDYPKDGVSSAIRGTNALCLNVEKWHERMYGRESRKEVLFASIAHELFHVQHYALKPPEERFWREFPAMLFEAAVIVKRGNDKGEKGIEFLWGSINSQKKQLLEARVDLDADFVGKTYNSQYTRGLGQTGANIIYEGEGLAGIESVCRGVLRVEELDAAAFDQVLKDEDARDGEELLSFERIRTKFREYLGRQGK